MIFSKYISIIIIFIFFISGCTSIKNTLTGGNKKNSDEFLVKKKDPLVMPPSFDDLPKPQTKKNENKSETENIDFSKVLNTPTSKKKTNKTNEKSLEKSISNILNNK